MTPCPPLTSVRLMVFILSGGKSLSFGQGGMGGRIGGYECTCVFMNVGVMIKCSTYCGKTMQNLHSLSYVYKHVNNLHEIV